MRNLFHMLQLICMICITTFSNGQQSDSIVLPHRSCYHPIEAGRDLLQQEKIFWTKPFHIHKRDWKIIIPAAAVLTGVLLNDHAIYNNWQNVVAENDDLYHEANIVSQLGEGTTEIGITAAFAVGSIAFKNIKARETATLAAEALITSGFVVTVFKYGFGRQRPQPENVEGNFEFFPKSLDSENANSFPSGHTISIWSLATVIATQYHDHWWVPVIAYTSATGVALSRVTLQKHWPGDVTAGALLGYAIGRMTVNQHNSRWGITPDGWTTGHPGIRISKQF